MSSTQPPQPLPPMTRVPSGPERLVRALYNPTYLAILASVGIHGLAVASIPVVAPIINGGQQRPLGPLETRIVKLTPAEAARIRSAFPVPKPTTVPPGLPYFNPNSTTANSLSPPPLSGDLYNSKASRNSFASLFGGTSDSSSSSSSSSSETSQTADNSSRVYSNWYTGESDVSGGESDASSGQNEVATRYGYPYSPGQYPDFYGYVGSTPPPPPGPSTTDKPAVKQRLNQGTTNPDKTPGNRFATRGTNHNNNGTGGNPESLSENAIELASIPGIRTAQDSIQDLSGNYQVLIIVDENGEVGWRYLGNDPVAEAAIKYTFDKLRPSVPSEPGEYLLTIDYSEQNSNTPPEVATTPPQPPAETPTDIPELLALQEDYPDYQTITGEPIPVISEVSAQAQVAIRVDADGNPEPFIIEGTGNEDLDQRALEEAQSRLDSASTLTLQIFEIQFNPSPTDQPETETPKPQPSLPSLGPNPQPSPNASEESTPQGNPQPSPNASEGNSKPSPEGLEESTPEGNPKPSPEGLEESTPQGNSESDEPVPDKTPIESEATSDNPEAEPTEKTPIEPSPEVHPKKPLLNQQSVLPSL